MYTSTVYKSDIECTYFTDVKWPSYPTKFSVTFHFKSFANETSMWVDLIIVFMGTDILAYMMW